MLNLIPARIMKALLISALFFLWAINVQSQVRVIDSLDNLIKKATSDTQKINLKIKKLKALANVNLDSSIALGKSIITESQQINYKEGEVKARLKLAGDYFFTGDYAAAKTNLDISKVIISRLNDSLLLEDLYGHYGTMYSMQNKFDSSHSFFAKSIEIGRAQKDNAVLSNTYQNNAIAFLQESNYPQALTNFQNALSIAEEMNDEESEAYIYLNMAITYKSLDDPKRGEQSYLKSVDLAKKLGLKNVLAYCYSNMATMYEDMKDFKKEYEFGMKAASLGNEIGDKGIEASSLSRAALGLANQGNFKEAEDNAKRAMLIADSSKQPLNVYQTNQDMGSILKMQKKYRDAISYYEKGFSSLDKSNIYDEEVGQSYANLSECYEQTGDFKKALASYKMAAKISDSITGKENVKKATELTLNYEFAKKQQIAKDEEQKQKDLAKAKQTALIIGLALTLLLAIVAFRAFTNKRKANLLLHQQKEKVESTLTELKSTQAQLIQSEKMACLGELTAGIAHEIQNPLNFVNNFSEVNTELIDEMKDELTKEIWQEAIEIADDIKENEEKINHHGKRADAIVKGMLQHSRSSTDVKEPTDINAWQMNIYD